MGNFAIVRVNKVKTMSSMAARGRHNFREQDTPNADPDRLDLNMIEGAKSTDELLKAVSDLLPQKRRKDAVIGLEYLIAASPEHFGEDWQKTENFGMDYFSDAITWLEKKHGKGNVVCKTVHLDESTPHLAAFVVPLKDGKLNAKAFTGGAKVLAEMQTSFAVEVGAKHGLDRGVERSKAVHQDNAKIQPMTIERMQLRKQVKALELEIERLTKSVTGGESAKLAVEEKLKEAQKALLEAQEAAQKAIAQAKASASTLAQYQAVLAASRSDLAKAKEAAQKAIEQAKAEAGEKTKTEIARVTAAARGAIQTAETKAQSQIDQLASDLTKAQEVAQSRRDHMRKLQSQSVADMGEIQKLKTEIATLNSELTASKKAQEAPQKPLERHSEAEAAWLAARADLPPPAAASGQNRTAENRLSPVAIINSGKVVESLGLHAVLLYKGEKFLHKFDSKQDLELSISRGRGMGISGRA